MASCLPGILPDLTPSEALEASLVASVAGMLEDGQISRAPLSQPAPFGLDGRAHRRGLRVRPGEVSRIWACCSSTNCPNSSAARSIRCASRSKPAK
jgi:predicted ATPase with chaperone activity